MMTITVPGLLIGIIIGFLLRLALYERPNPCAFCEEDVPMDFLEPPEKREGSVKIQPLSILEKFSGLVRESPEFKAQKELDAHKKFVAENSL